MLVGRQAVELCTCVVGGGWFVEGELVWSVTMRASLPASATWPSPPSRSCLVGHPSDFCLQRLCVKSGGEARKSNYDIMSKMYLIAQLGYGVV